MSNKKTATPKNNPSSAKKASKSTKKSTALLLSLAPFVIFAIALFAQTCLVLGADAGLLGGAVKKLLYGLLGHAAHVLCIGALVLAFFFGELRREATLRFKLISGGALVLMSAALTSLILQNGMRGISFSFENFYNSGAAGKSGGVLGSALGILLSRLLSPVGATVIAAIAALALLSFTAGITKLGLWRMFLRQPHRASTAPVGKENEKAHTKKPAPPKVSPVTVDTVISGEQYLPNTPPDALEPSYLPSQYLGQEPDGEEFTDGDFDRINESSYGTVDFNDAKSVANVYTPIDLMDEFGLRPTEKEQTDDIYDESPKPAPKPAHAPKRTSGGVSYSPFATFKSEEEVLKRPSPASKNAAPARPNDTAYSPFADPFRSIEEKKAPAPKSDYEVYKSINPTPAAPAQSAPAVSVNDAHAPAYAIDTPAYTNIPNSAAHAEPSAPSYSTPNLGASYPSMPTPSTPSIFDTPVYEAHVSSAQSNESPFAAPVTEEAQFYSAPTDDESFDDESLDDEAEYSDPISVQPQYTPKTHIAGAPTMPNFAPTEMSQARTPAPARTQTAEESHNINPFMKYQKLRYPRYHKPPTDLLDPVDTSTAVTEQEIYEVQSKLHNTFENFNVNAAVTGYSVGPSITRYEITPGPQVRAKQITLLGEDISLALQSEKRKGDIRIVTVQGKSVMGVEVPNSKTKKVSLRALIESKDFQNAKSKITVCIGLTVSGKPVYMNIDDMPHVLVAGQTKSGKSVAINCMIISLIYRASPDEVQLILIDPKRVELSIYNDIPHMVMPVIDDPKRAAAALKWAVAEMERRYDLLNKAHVRNRDEYYLYRDQNPDFEYMPQIVIIIDELADLMLQVKEHVESLINRLAAMARACGMHVIIGTQRPSVAVVTGLIKANIPSHIAFKVASGTDSKVILGNVGAEKLLGRGDMLYHPTGSNQSRAQGAFVDTPEIKRVLNYIIEKNGKAEYDPDIMLTLQEETDKLNKVEKKSAMSDDDFAIDGYDPDFDLLCKATEIVLMAGSASKNTIQRKLNIGFNRAANLFDKLVDLNFIAPQQGVKPSEVLIDWQTYENWKNNHQT